MTSPLTPQAPEPDAPTQVASAVPVRPRRRRGLLVGVSVAGALVLMAAGAAIAVSLDRHGSTPPAPAATTTPAPTNTPFTAEGVLELNDSPGVMNLDDTHCQGMGGYDDIQAGAQVVISDESGTVLATGQLELGFMVGSGVTRTCRFDWTVSDVPAGHSFYGVAVTHRGSVQYTQEQLVSGPDMSLG